VGIVASNYSHNEKPKANTKVSNGSKETNHANAISVEIIGQYSVQF
jgi:hypothetical protein